MRFNDNIPEGTLSACLPLFWLHLWLAFGVNCEFGFELMGIFLAHVFKIRVETSTDLSLACTLLMLMS